MKRFLLLLFRIPQRLQQIFFKLWNHFIFFLNNCTFGKNLKVFNRFHLYKNPGAKLQIGDNFLCTSGSNLNPLCRHQTGAFLLQYPNSELIIGNNVGMSSPCIWVQSQIKIGDRVLIGGDCIIMDTDAHSLDHRCRHFDPNSFSPDDLPHKLAEIGLNLSDLQKNRSVDALTTKSAPIIIENDVLIGTRSIILKGITIGARSVIAAGSVVTKSIPSDCIAGGNPCKVIRFLA